MTSTRKPRWCDDAVTRSRSTDSRATSIALAVPIVMSDPTRSLSIVEATPTTDRPLRDSACAPACEPLPPMTTSREMSRSHSCCKALSCPAAVVSSMHRVVPRMVPPRCMIAADVPQAERHEFAGNEPCVPMAHAEHLEAARDSHAHHGADRRVHSGGIATAGQDRATSHRRIFRIAGSVHGPGRNTPVI